MKYQSGNALFLILIAVALFAALSYAITSSGRGGGNIDREQAQIAAAEIASYAAQAQQAITRMKLINGCDDREISFDHPRWVPDFALYTYLDANRNVDMYTPPADKRCHFFDKNGGNMPFYFNESWSDTSKSAVTYYILAPYFTGHPFIKGVGEDGVPVAENTELLIVFTFLKKEVCDEINKSAGIDTPPIVPLIALNERLGFGPYAKNNTVWVDTGDILAGQTFACFEGQDHINAAGLLIGTCHAYQVLIAR